MRPPQLVPLAPINQRELQEARAPACRVLMRSTPPSPAAPPSTTACAGPAISQQAPPARVSGPSPTTTTKKPTITSLKKKKTVFAVPSESSSRACFAFLCHGRISQTASTVMAAAVRMFLTRLFRLATMAPNSQMSQKLQSATEDPV